MAPLWTIELLGGLRARSRDRTITRFQTRQAGALLAYLAFYRQRPHPRAYLAETCWPDDDPEIARRKLRIALSSLRRQLEPPGTGAGTVLVTTRVEAQINPATTATDVSGFQAALAASAVSSRLERAQRLEAAVARYGGELLPGHYEEWINLERRRLEESYLQALAQLARLLEELGDLDRALHWARRAVDVDPLREEAHQELTRLLLATGQPEAAERQYRELERLLHAEVGAAPEAASQRLAGLAAARHRPAAADPAAGSPPRASVPQRPAVEPPAASPALASLPAGIWTLLMTEIKPSDALRDRAGAGLCQALETHGRLIGEAVARHAGSIIRQTRDSFVIAFRRPMEGLAAAAAAQAALTAEPWPAEIGPVQVRMALHTGELEGGIKGPLLDHLIGLTLAAHGGQILLCEATAALLREHPEPGFLSIDLGLFRLRSGAPPERLFQAHSPEIPPGPFPPPNAAPAYEGHLPLRLTRFFGREEEIARLRRLFWEEKRRLVTLTGPGGSGKTRLALEAAEQLREPLGGAVWFVALADLTEPVRMAEVIRNAMRLPHSSQQEPLEQIMQALSRQPSLLVLDNCEHLVTDGASLVIALLERVPALSCVVTSRRPLAVSGERDFPVGSLPTPEQTDSPEQLMTCASVQLFVDRSQAVRPDFQMTQANMAAIAKLCRHLEGLPLALELAAARARTMTPGQMLAQLSRRFEFLVARQRNAPARHQSLWSAFDWSYQLLTPQLQRFFARLSVFRGGWTEHAAQVVCEAPQARDFLEELREHSLILSEGSSPEPRFGMLETMREYALEQLPEIERTTIESRHAQYYLSLAEDAEPALKRSEQDDWFARLDAEQENILSTLRWAKIHGETELRLRLAGALHFFWSVRGHHDEARNWLEGMDPVLEPAPTPVRVKALYSAAEVSYHQGDFVRATALATESLRLSQSLDDRWRVADALGLLGELAVVQDKPVQASALLEETVKLSREVGNRWALALALNSQSHLAFRSSDYRQTAELLESCLTINRDIGDKHTRSSMLGELGVALMRLGNSKRARDIFEEQLVTCQQSGHATSTARALYYLAILAVDRGDYLLAAAQLAQSVAVLRQLGDRPCLADSLSLLATIARLQGDFGKARSLYEESLKIRQEIGGRYDVGRLYLHLGWLAVFEARHEEARTLLEESLRIHRESMDKHEISRSLHALANLSLCDGDPRITQTCLRESLSISQEIGDRQGVAECLETSARLACAYGQPERTAQLLGAADELRHKIDFALPPVDRPGRDRAVATARKALGDEAFATAWAMGKAMSLDQVICLVLRATPA